MNAKTEKSPDLSMQTDDPRVIHVDGTLNFRDLGGYKGSNGGRVRWGKMFRSAQFDKLTEHGIETLSNLGVKTVIDLRFGDETERYPTIAQAFPKARFYTWHGEKVAQSNQPFPEAELEHQTRSWRKGLAEDDPQAVREAMRLDYPAKLYTHRAIYRRMLLELADDSTPLLFHCAAGKDRTGVAAALILSLLGVDEDQIIEDYLLTQSLLGDRLHRWMAGGAADAKHYDDFQAQLKNKSSAVLKPIMDADRDYIATLLDYVAQQYDGFAAYAKKQLLLDDTTLLALKHQLLE